MARKRMVDPSIWTDEGMAELTYRQQLLYIGLFSNADDEGRLKGSAAAIRLILPTVYPGTPLEEVDADVAAVLAAMRQLVRYEADGRVYLAFRNYRQWQRIDKPSPSILPAPPDPDGSSPNPPRTVADVSTNVPVDVVPNRKEEKGREVREREEKQTEVTPPAAGADKPRDEPHLVTAVPKPKDQGRENPHWDALVAGVGIAPQTGAERSRYGRVVKQLKEAGATPDEILKRCANYRAHWPEMDLTPDALVNHWARMEKPPPRGSPNVVTFSGTPATGDAKFDRTLESLRNVGRR